MRHEILKEPACRGGHTSASICLFSDVSPRTAQAGLSALSFVLTYLHTKLYLEMPYRPLPREGDHVFV
jgi:hypothetical protein